MKVNLSKSLKDLGEQQHIQNIFKAIKSDKWKDNIEDYRKDLSNPDKAKKIKSQLPCFTISGFFKDKRTLDCINSYNPIIHLDYDKLSEDKANEIIEIVSRISFTYCAFKSPSYGVKVFIRSNSNVDNHEEYFNSIRAFYDNAIGFKSDKSVKDITRLCFISYDPNLYFNNNSKTFELMNTLDNLWEFTSNRLTYKEGDRNNFIHLFACNANRWGLNIEEVKAYLINRSDLDENEIVLTVVSSYKNNEDEFGRYAKSSKYSKTSISNSLLDDEDKTPIIPPELYALLPEKLKQATDKFKDREKDVFVTGLITSLSSVMHNVYGVYGGDKVYPNLFSFVTAPAASGKSSVKYAKEILRCYHESLKSSNTLEDTLFFIPANTSSSMIYKMLENNNGVGLIFETEADALSNTMKQEWGNFSDVLRKAFHNETISQARRQDNEYYQINSPKFSVCLTGTNEQVKRLIHSTEDGLFSRFLMYSFTSDFSWNNPFEKSNSFKYEYFEKLNDEMCNLLKEKENKTRVFKLSTSQEELFNRRFTSLESNFKEKYSNALDVYKRAGLKVFKIAMTLSAFRYLGYDKEEIVCNDDDFKFALEAVTKVYLHHQLKVIESLYSQTSISINNGADFMYSILPEGEFGRDEIITAYNSVSSKKPSPRTISKHLKSLESQNKIRKIQNGVYLKVG